jgi:hypothetical protein
MLYQEAKSQISKAIREPQGGKAILSNHQAHNVESTHKPSPTKTAAGLSVQALWLGQI